MAAKKLNFEQSLERLELIVRQLENGELSLNDSLKLFEEGTKLISACTKLLDEAEQRVSVLKETGNGDMEPVPFDSEN